MRSSTNPWIQTRESKHISFTFVFFVHIDECKYKKNTHHRTSSEMTNFEAMKLEDRGFLINGFITDLHG